MKLSANKQEENLEEQTGPKLRNIHEEKEAPKETPKGVDIRIKLGTAAVLVLVLFVGIKGFIGNSSLSSQVSEQKKALDKIQAEAKEYGIVKDENDDLIIPDMESEDGLTSEAGPVEERNMKIIDAFSKQLLNWKGKSGYTKARQALMDEWGFKETSKLLTTFMPELTEDLDANMGASGSPTVFVLSDDDGDISYFLIYEVKNTINGTSAAGKVGIHLTIKEDGTMSNVTAQTLS